MTAQNCKMSYSIGARLSRQIFWQAALGLGVVGVVIYGAAFYLFKTKHDDAIDIKMGVVQEVVKAAYQRGGPTEVATKSSRYVFTGVPGHDVLRNQ